MAFQIIAESNLSIKNVDGIDQLVQPIVYAKEMEMGVGLLKVDGITNITLPSANGIDLELLDTQGKITYFGAGPKNLIQSYRAMEILNELYTIRRSTLINCWYAGDRNLHPVDQDHADIINHIITKEKRDEILERVPENIDDMLTILEVVDLTPYGLGDDFLKSPMTLTDMLLKDIQINQKYTRLFLNLKEIDDEVQEGRLKVTPQVSKFLTAYYENMNFIKMQAYGLEVSPSIALECMNDKFTWTSQTSAFTKAFNESVNPDSKKALNFGQWDSNHYFVTGESKINDNYEITLIKGEFGVFCGVPKHPLMIGVRKKNREVKGGIKHSFVYVAEGDHEVSSETRFLVERSYEGGVLMTGNPYDIQGKVYQKILAPKGRFKRVKRFMRDRTIEKITADIFEKVNYNRDNPIPVYDKPAAILDRIEVN